MTDGCIYAIEHPTGAVKIGFSGNPISRIISFQADPESKWPNGERASVKLLGYVPNRPKTEEAELHRIFKKFRVGGEWHSSDSPAIRWVVHHQLFVPYGGPLFEPRKMASRNKSALLAIRVPTDLKEELQDMARYEKTTVSSLINGLIKDKLVELGLLQID